MSTSAGPVDRPDIVLIHGHDLGDWLSAYGWSAVPDGHLERLAASSVLFQQAFASSPLCTPARSSIFTGLLPHQNGLMGLSHDGWHYSPGVVTLPERLSGLGYRTALLGLQHEDLDARVLGYDDVRGLGFPARSLEVVKLAERWLAEGSDEPAPRFASVGFWEVHRPWPHEDYDPADPDDVDVPPYLPDNEHTRRDIADFMGAIRQLDQAVGRLMDLIDATPRGRETLVVFTTDHGAPFPRAKSTLYDSGVKVALMVRPPASWGVEPRRIPQVVSHLDLVPTLVSVAGGTVAGLDGVDLVPLIRGLEAGEVHDELVLEKTFHDRYDPIRAVRTHDAKYIRNYVEGPKLPLPTDLELSESRRGMDREHLVPRPAEELYLLDRDPWELDNVAGSPDAAELKRQLSDRLDYHLRRTADPLEVGHVPAPEPPRRQ